MTSAELLRNAFDQIHDLVHRAVDGLTPEQLARRPEREANSIAWLIWHLTRVQDDHVADAFGEKQVWTERGWYDRFGLPFDADATGYGQSADEVGRVTVSSGELLTGYHDAVYERTCRLIEPLGNDDLERIVDRSWDPPVTLGVRLSSVIGDDLQHVGQASYLRGLDVLG